MCSFQKNYENYFLNKKVLITGNTGFKGSWLTLYLLQLGAKVYGLSSAEKTNEEMYHICQIKNSISQYYFDVTDAIRLKELINEVQPDVVFHLAAQAITLKGYDEPLATFRINAMGTACLLDSFRTYEKACDIVLVTSDKCYKNNEWTWGYRENDILAGADPYSASKSIAEIIFQSYYQSFFKDGPVNVVSARAGNVIGGGDWSLYRIVPNCMEAWMSKETLAIRYPNAVRPWNDILDIVHAYALLASQVRIKKLNGESFNFGPQWKRNMSVRDLVIELWNAWIFKDFEPFKIAEQTDALSEYQYLKLNVEKANEILEWYSLTPPEEMLQRTANWYLNYMVSPGKMRLYTIGIIEDYLEKIYSDGRVDNQL